MPRHVVFLTALMLAGCGGSSNPSGPYPECPAIIRHLQDNMGEPETLQIMKWGKRKVIDGDGDYWPKGTILVPVKYRGKNRAGAMVVESVRYEIRNGKPINTGTFGFD